MKSILSLSLAAAFAFCALCTYILLDSRREAVEQAYNTNADLVQAISQDVSRNLEIYDLSLQGVIKALAQPDIDQVSPTIRRMALFDNAAQATYFNRIAVANAQGDVTDQSLDSQPLTGNLSDREYFTVQRDDPDRGLYISKPFESRLTPGEWVIALSRRIPGPGGSFAGIVVGTIDINYFQSLFVNLRAEPQSGFTVLRGDGIVIMHYPFRLGSVGHDLSGGELFRHFPAERRGGYDGQARSNSSGRLFSFSQVGNFPLIVVVASAESVMLQTWRHKALLIGALMAIFAIILVALALALRHELHRRRLTEKKLESAVAALAVAAATDGLTGLANRRRLDETAEIEWKRSTRNGALLSILIADVDFFKAYNDTCGHPAGDDVLKAVASCIRATLARPSDFAARYGGEEFALLLPDTPGRGALKVAESLRATIAERNIPHPQGLNKKISVSIGITTIVPHSGTSFAKAFAMADEALYRAKRLGRDRVVHTDGTLTAATRVWLMTPDNEASAQRATR